MRESNAAWRPRSWRDLAWVWTAYRPLHGILSSVGDVRNLRRVRCCQHAQGWNIVEIKYKLDAMLQDGKYCDRDASVLREVGIFRRSREHGIGWRFL